MLFLCYCYVIAKYHDFYHFYTSQMYHFLQGLFFKDTSYVLHLLGTNIHKSGNTFSYSKLAIR